MGPVRGASEGPVRGENCDLSPSRSRASARPAVGCPIAYRVCRIVATGPLSGRRDPASGPRRAAATQAAIGPVGAPWRRT